VHAIHDLGAPAAGVASSQGVGYAAGLLGLVDLNNRPAGRYAICGASSIGAQELAVTIVETRE
jgi:hypothetical protein